MSNPSRPKINNTSVFGHLAALHPYVGVFAPPFSIALPQPTDDNIVTLKDILADGTSIQSIPVDSHPKPTNSILTLADVITDTTGISLLRPVQANPRYTSYTYSCSNSTNSSFSYYRSGSTSSSTKSIISVDSETEELLRPHQRLIPIFNENAKTEESKETRRREQKKTFRFLENPKLYINSICEKKDMAKLEGQEHARAKNVRKEQYRNWDYITLDSTSTFANIVWKLSDRSLCKAEGVLKTKFEKKDTKINGKDAQGNESEDKESEEDKDRKGHDGREGGNGDKDQNSGHEDVNNHNGDGNGNTKHGNTNPSNDDNDDDKKPPHSPSKDPFKDPEDDSDRDSDSSSSTTTIPGIEIYGIHTPIAHPYTVPPTRPKIIDTHGPPYPKVVPKAPILPSDEVYGSYTAQSTTYTYPDTHFPDIATIPPLRHPTDTVPTSVDSKKTVRIEYAITVTYIKPSLGDTDSDTLPIPPRCRETRTGKHVVILPSFQDVDVVANAARIYPSVISVESEIKVWYISEEDATTPNIQTVTSRPFAIDIPPHPHPTISIPITDTEERSTESNPAYFIASDSVMDGLEAHVNDFLQPPPLKRSRPIIPRKLRM
ncbi:hypothetical protein P280DRAFT_546718 [Massarina eburnea CBS 473.64]|uniref:Uncharacterized protein n=1 Tax=Massarina eburnea CBS 473.64 TaxID=1395130 RepID=A0A6A6S9C0_9PLEO|nr:hypothetical protein P280DRAFT_546718 [Massarina eburnea CBS 473.64]